ncbi:MAG: methyltransferase domain-containing protein [Bacteroidota bacterium]
MLSKFKYRSQQSEMLDGTNIPKSLLFQNLKELDFINRTLGGHTVTVAGIKKLISDKNKTYHIIDIGCGGGDAMKSISDWATKNNYKVKLTGVDQNADAIEYMNNYCKGYAAINGVVSDYREYLKINPTVDIVHCSLFCHHLKEKELIELFVYLKHYAKTGFIINDLERHWFAYYSIKYLTRLLSDSVLVKNDAPISVLRGFKKKELEKLFQQADINDINISWKWAFRFLAIHKNNQQ